jgi:hypothetical protein
VVLSRTQPPQALRCVTVTVQLVVNWKNQTSASTHDNMHHVHGRSGLVVEYPSPSCMTSSPWCPVPLLS